MRKFPWVPPLTIALALLLGMVPSRPAAAKPPEQRPRYHIIAELDYPQATLNVRQQVFYTNTTNHPLDGLVFRVIPAHYGAITLLQALIQGEEIAPRLEATLLELPLSKPLVPGESTVIELKYRLVVPPQGDRFGVHQGVIALGNWFPILAPYRTALLTESGQPLGWAREPYLPVGDAFFAEVADFRVDLISNRPVTVAHSGRLWFRTESRWGFQAEGIRDFALAISERYQVRSVEVQGTTIAAYVLPEHLFLAERYLEAASQMVVWLGQRLAPYPYSSLHLAEIPSTIPSFVGQEYPNLVFLSSSLSAEAGDLGSGLANIVLHEVAHQWFYGLVGNDQWYEPWADEAVVTWLALHFLRENHPNVFPGAWERHLLRRLLSERSLALGKQVNGRVDQFSGDGPYFAVVYRKGAEFLERAYQAQGQQSFWGALRQYVSLFREEIAPASALLDLLEEASPQNLRPLMAEYFTYPRFLSSEPLEVRVTFPAQTPWSGEMVIGLEPAVAHVALELDGQLWQVVQDRGELTLDTPGLSDGTHLLRLTLSDGQGRSARRLHRVTVANASAAPSSTAASAFPQGPSPEASPIRVPPLPRLLLGLGALLGTVMVVAGLLLRVSKGT